VRGQPARDSPAAGVPTRTRGRLRCGAPGPHLGRDQSRKVSGSGQDVVQASQRDTGEAVGTDRDHERDRVLRSTSPCQARICKKVSRDGMSVVTDTMPFMRPTP